LGSQKALLGTGGLLRVKKRRFMFISHAGTALMTFTGQRTRFLSAGWFQFAVMIEFFHSGEALDNSKKYEG
jgi:hypothetical protein